MNRNDISTRVCHIFFVTAKYVLQKNNIQSNNESCQFIQNSGWSYS